jgi:hypothetical protein
MGGSVFEPKSVRKLATSGEIEWHIAIAPGGQACLLVRGAKASLARIAEAHLRVASPVCPKPWAHDLDAGAPWVAFDCDPVGTFEEVSARWPKRSLPYGEAIVVTHTLGVLLRAAHESGICLGALAPAQVLVDRSGALKVLGLGFDEATWSERAVRAPTVAMGHPPTPSSDVHTALLFLRAHIPWVADVPPALARILSGAPGPVERAFARVLFAILTQTGKVDGASGLRQVERFWSLVGAAPDHHAMGQRLRETFGGVVPRVDLGRDFSWLSVDGGPRHDLLRREPVRRVLRALVAAGGDPVPVDRLVASAWPGEALVGSSGADRLYVAISTLRKLDLRSAIAREPSGYALRAEIVVRDS